jgi:micrococcal nuclease
MNGTPETIRMIGVDTPETHDPDTPVQCYGPAASAYTKNLIGEQRVRLEADPTNQNRDRYNRLLRYVYLPDGRLVEAEIIKNGYGFSYTQFPFTKTEEFEALEAEAKAADRGLWGNCTVTVEESGREQTNPASETP